MISTMKSCPHEPLLILEYHGLVWDYATWKNLAAGRYPDTFPNFDWFAEEGEGRVVPVVITGEEIRSLADAGIRANPHKRVVVDPYVLSQPDMIADLQEPWRLDVNARFYHHALPHLRAKGAQDRDFDLGG